MRDITEIDKFLDKMAKYWHVTQVIQEVLSWVLRKSYDLEEKD